MKKFELTFTMLTRVVEEPRVRAAVKSAHMAMLKSIFSPKKVALMISSMGLLSGGGERRLAIDAERVDVRAVVVLFKAFVRTVFAERCSYIQLRENSIESGAGSTRNGEENPHRQPLQEVAHH